MPRIDWVRRDTSIAGRGLGRPRGRRLEVTGDEQVAFDPDPGSVSPLPVVEVLPVLAWFVAGNAIFR